MIGIRGGPHRVDGVDGEDVFFGRYPVRPHKVVARGETTGNHDLVGKGGETSDEARQVQRTPDAVRQQPGDHRKERRP
ncbi:hypothetical protein [Streptomyces sp. NPDC088757]|uniref:hypothetical protein n=1 Tax=Streptomyces sp. NPDC088757 TaxID=3365889 RepID=UPI003809C5E5